MTPRSTAGAAIIAACLLATGCSSDTAEEPAQHIVLNLGGQVVELDTVDSRPRTVGTYPKGGEDLDVFTLTTPRQMPSGEVVGIRDGAAVVVSLDAVEKATALGPAVDWFPATTDGRIWTVTEPEDDTACDREELPESARARVRIADHDIVGRPAKRTITLGCGIEPVAETAAGIAAHRITDDIPSEGNGASGRTAVVLLGERGQPERTVAESGTIHAAAGHRIIMSVDHCTAEACTSRETESRNTIYDTESKKRQVFPKCDTGEPSGSGAIDSTGRWYATVTGAERERPTLSVVDLNERTCRDIGPFPGLAEGSDLPDALSAVWTGANLVLLDPSSGDVATHHAPSGATAHRKRSVDVTNGGQVWGALS
ncbi:hypothetical protein [Streptomyces sp. bgisy100]|uniref:hypothetical protein n=1 Tax=Streptomyces sp. bgisy100 TaxID=3413783 RepID=UPI003D71F7D6